jgi:hypothetical protein
MGWLTIQLADTNIRPVIDTREAIKALTTFLRDTGGVKLYFGCTIKSENALMIFMAISKATSETDSLLSGNSSVIQKSYFLHNI